MKRFVLVVLLSALLAECGMAQGSAARKPESFPEAIRSLRKGVFLVGFPGGRGTAWVLSRQHRLLATNAHVADILAIARKEKTSVHAIMNGTSERLLVTRAWYHPGVRRFPTPDRQISVRAATALNWEVDPRSPDVAVIELAPGGPELPVEFPLAAPGVVYDLQSLPVAILGYPGHDTLAFPRAGEAVEATFHEGVVSRATDFALRATTPERAQRLQYTMATFSGFSGSPIFLRSGEVVGLHNAGRNFEGTQIANGIRVDSLWELLVHHRLTDKVPIPLNASQLDLQRFSEPDPAYALYLRLRSLVEEARDLIYNKLQYQAGIDKCTEALTLFDRYAPAYRARADAYNNWYFRRGDDFSFDQNLSLLEKALKDASRNLELHKGTTSLDGQVDALRCRIFVLNNLGNLTEKKTYNLQALEDVEKILSVKDISRNHRAAALSAMAISFANLDQADKALAKHNEAVLTDPDSAVLWENRATFLNKRNPTMARSDRDMASQIRKRSNLLQRTGGKEQKLISKVENKLTAQDPLDNQGCHYHHWQVDLSAGYFYQIDLKNPSFRKDGDYDPILRLYDASGRLLRDDDDGGGYPHSRIFFTATADGSYRLVVTSYVQRQTGPYVLTVYKIAEDK